MTDTHKYALNKLKNARYFFMQSCLFSSHLSIILKGLLSLSFQRSTSGLYHHFNHLQRCSAWSC